MADELAFVILMSASAANRNPPARGSVLITANDGHRAFLAPTVRRFLKGKGRGAYTICSECAADSDPYDGAGKSNESSPSGSDERC